MTHEQLPQPQPAKLLKVQLLLLAAGLLCLVVDLRVGRHWAAMTFGFPGLALAILVGPISVYYCARFRHFKIALIPIMLSLQSVWWLFFRIAPLS